MNYKEKIILQHIALFALLDNKEQSQERKVKWEEIFPELKESEDEKIKKEIIGILRNAYWTSNRERFNELVAWLEKQVSLQMVVEAYLRGCNDTEKKWLEKQNEQKPTDTVKPKFKVGDKIRIKTPSSFDKDMEVARIEKDYYLCNHIGKFSSEVVPFSKESSYELVEHKPANKVEPVFNVGDWVVGANNVFKIISLNNELNCYIAVTQNNEEVKIPYYFDGAQGHMCSYHLWTIKDAKDGDVLCDYHEEYDNPLIFILKKFEHVNFGLVRPSDYSSYCFLTAGDIQRFKEGRYHHKHNIKPATKEQRDILFQKMKEAGYEWFANKKELKKIEQKM